MLTHAVVHGHDLDVVLIGLRHLLPIAEGPKTVPGGLGLAALGLELHVVLTTREEAPGEGEHRRHRDRFLEEKRH
jgi:hypothetical protein